METRSRVASLSARLGIAAVVLAALGPALVHLAGARPMAGFAVFQVGLLAALLSLVLGAIGLVRTRAGSGREGRRAARLGTALGALLVGTVVLVNARGFGVPPINDITTSPDDAPAFGAVDGFVPAPYDAARLAPIQRETGAYADLQPIVVDASPTETFARARAAAHELGWEVVREDAAGGMLQATHTSRLFLFVDDVVVRIRPHQPSGSVVDVRSKSRDGRGDIGANAARIRAFREGLLARSGGAAS